MGAKIKGSYEVEAAEQVHHVDIVPMVGEIFSRVDLHLIILNLDEIERKHHSGCAKYHTDIAIDKEYPVSVVK